MASISELGSYTWRIKDWASHTRDERLESIHFTAGGMTWCVAPLEGCTISRGDLVGNNGPVNFTTGAVKFTAVKFTSRFH